GLRADDVRAGARLLRQVGLEIDEQCRRGEFASVEPGVIPARRAIGGAVLIDRGVAVAAYTQREQVAGVFAVEVIVLPGSTVAHEVHGLVPDAVGQSATKPSAVAANPSPPSAKPRGQSSATFVLCPLATSK